MSFGSHNVNEDMFGFQDEDDEDPEVFFFLIDK